MAIVLFPLTLLFCFFFLSSFSKSDERSIRRGIVNAFLVIGSIVAALTELLSTFNRIERVSVIAAWSLVAAAFGFASLLRRSKIKHIGEVFTSMTSTFVKSIREIKLVQFLFADAVVTALTAILLLGVFIVSLTVTNNYDSYTYHLPRIEYWIQNHNVDFFQTNDVRRLYRNPLGEYVILHLKLLSGSNIANNFVQYACYLLSGIVVTLIAQELGASRRQQLYAAVMALTVPMAMLQAETTQTDLVVAFFVLTCAYYCLKLVRAESMSGPEICYLCLSIALGILAKGTFYIFAFPFCLLLTVVLLMRHRHRVAMSVVVLLAVVLIIDGPFLLKNYRTFGFVFGPLSGPMSDGILNEEISVRVIVSNMVRDISLHLALPYQRWNNLIISVVERAHKIIGLSTSDPRTTWYPPYRLMFMVWHDLLGSFIHLILVVWTGLILIVRWRRIGWQRIRYYLYCVAGFIGFFGTMKWNVFNPRWDVVGLLLFAPIIVLLLPKKMVVPCSVVLLMVGNLIVYRFQWGGKAILSEEFLSSKGAATYAVNYQASRHTIEKLKASGVKRVGFAANVNFTEWSYWLASDKQQFRHVLFPRALLGVPNFDPQFTYRALIIEKSCIVNGGNGCLVAGALNNFIADNPDVASVEDFENSTELVIFTRDQSRLFLY